MVLCVVLFYTTLHYTKENIISHLSMHHITSKDNEQIKFLRKLKQKKHREKYGRFFVENATMIADAARAGCVCEKLFLTNEFQNKHEELMRVLEKHVVESRQFLMIDAVNRSFSNLETPSGIAAVYAQQEQELDFAESIVYLNGITDPGNVGTIIRSAVAFGFFNIVVDEGCADVTNPKTLHAAKDAFFKVRICFDKKREALNTLKKEMPIIVTEMQGISDIQTIKKRKKLCLVLGNEAHGVDADIQKLADASVAIPMSGKIESLNVASAAAILLYELSKNKN